MVKRVFTDYIQDILDSIHDIENFIQEMSYNDFKDDRKTINTVVRSIEIIGEASKKIPKSLRDSRQEIPWKKIAGLRDKTNKTRYFKDPGKSSRIIIRCARSSADRAVDFESYATSSPNLLKTK